MHQLLQISGNGRKLADALASADVSNGLSSLAALWNASTGSMLACHANAELTTSPTVAVSDTQRNTVQLAAGGRGLARAASVGH
jgi:hypothetical protein